MTPEIASKVAVWRAKAANNTLTLEEMREAIAIMRQGRLGAAAASSAARRSRAKAEIPDAEDLLAEMRGVE